MNNDTAQQHLNNIVASYAKDSHSIIAIKGKNSAKFLQGQITINSEKLQSLQIRPGLYCDIKGRIEASFQLFNIDNTFYMLLPKDNAPGTINELKKYAMLSRVTVEDCKDFVPIYIKGQDISSKFDAEIKEKLLTETKYGYIFSIYPDYYCHITKLAQSDDLISFLNSWNIPFSEKNFMIDENIQRKSPEVYDESKGIFLPHYVNAADNMVDFDKGCFRGQEVIARMQYKVKAYKYDSCPYRVSDSFDIKPGQVVKNSDDKNIGNVIMVSNSSNLALLMLDVKYIDDTQQVKINGKNIKIEKV